jgi:hypothetical protein
VDMRIDAHATASFKIRDKHAKTSIDVIFSVMITTLSFNAYPKRPSKSRHTPPRPSKTSLSGSSAAADLIL